MSMRDTAFSFVDACDSGKGWDACKEMCTDGATFTCQADALAEISTVEDYVGWAAGLLTPIPDAHYELLSLAVDEERSKVTATAVFKGTNTGEGPVPPTGNSIASDYVYLLQFDGGKISNMHKVWNDGHGLRQLGWA